MRKDILFVDDDTAVLQAYRKLFDTKYSIDIADSVNFAESLLADNEYRIMITDYRLQHPQKGGLSLIQFVHEHHSNTHIIMITAYSNKGLQEKAKKAGVSRFFAKPVSFASLLATVKSLF